MALLHYKLAHLGPHWVLSCEDVPVEMYPSYAKAVDGAQQLVARASARGDTAVLQADRANRSTAPH